MPMRINIAKTVQSTLIRRFGVLAVALEAEHAKLSPYPGTVTNAEGSA